MRQKHFLTALAIFAVTGAINLAESLPAVWEGKTLIHKVGADAYTGMSQTGSDYVRAQQGAVSSERFRQTEEYKAGSPNNESRYSANPSAQKESTASPTSPYSEMVYGGVPTTPSADPLVKELNR